MRRAPPSRATCLDRADLVDGAHRRARRSRGRARWTAAGTSIAERRGTRARRSWSSRWPAARGRWGRPGSCRRCRSRRRGPSRASRRRAPRRPARAGRAPGGPRPRSRRCRRSGCRCGECRPSRSQARGGLDAGVRPRRRRREEIEKPNFWSSCAVAMYSWVCASTPAVTRIITPDGTPSSAVDLGQPLDLVEGVDDDPAHAERRAARRARRAVLLLPWKPIRAVGKPARSATVSSPPEQTSRCSPSSASHRATVVHRNALPA